MDTGALTPILSMTGSGGSKGGGGLGGLNPPPQKKIIILFSAQYALDCMRKPLEIKKFPGGGLDPFTVIFFVNF